MDDIAKDQMPHLIRINPGTFYRLPHHERSQFSGGGVLERSTIITDSGSNAAQDHDLASTHEVPPAWKSV
jgi:hypothetical protein